MEIPIVEKEVQSHQSHYKVSRTSSRPPFWPRAPPPRHPPPAFPWAHPLAAIQMTLAPNYRLSPEDGKVVKIRKNRNAESAVTRYRLLASSSACSLLELQPITGEACQGVPRAVSAAGSAFCAALQSRAALEVGTRC